MLRGKKKSIFFAFHVWFPEVQCVSNPALWENMLQMERSGSNWKILKRNKPQLLHLSEPSVLIIDVNIHFDTFSATDGNLTTCLTHERVMMLR